MKKLCSLLFATLCLLAPLAALAAEELAANPVGEAVAGALSGVVFPVLAALFVGLVGLVLEKLRQRYNLQISAAQQQRLEEAARAAVAYAEERAAAAVKANLVKITGREKLDLALAFLLQQTPKLSREQADALVHAALGKSFGLGASKNLAA